MLVLGLLILLFTAAVVIAAVAKGSDPATLDLQVFEVKTDVTGVFLTGAVCFLLVIIGLILVTKGLKRSRRRRAEIHSLRDRAARGEHAQAAGSPSTATQTDDRQSPPPSGKKRGDSTADDYFDSTPRDQST